MMPTMSVLRRRVDPYVRLMRLDRPIGSWLLYWPTLIAIYLAAAGQPGWRVLIGFALGTVFMRSAGCVVNDMADRDFDGQVRRTAARPLATGELQRRQALPLLLLLLLASAALLLLWDRHTFYWSLPALALAMLYPLMKRWTYLPQVILGAAFSWSIPLAFVAQGQSPGRSAWLLYAAALAWVVAYDTQYAMVDRDDDVRIGVRSTAILFAELDLTMIALLQALFLGGLFLLGRSQAWRWPFDLALVAAALRFAWQGWSCRGRQPEVCFAAFLDNHRVGALLFVGIFVSYLLPLSH